jgi:hypothetical protein
MVEPADNLEVTDHLLNKFFEIVPPIVKNYIDDNKIGNKYFTDSNVSLYLR